jgi:hypothetical protein
MKNLTSLVAVLSLILTACEPGYTWRSGDLGGFILQEAVKRGGRAINTNGLAVVDAHWRYKADAQGIQIYAAGNRVAAVEAFLGAAFGPPDPNRGSQSLAPASEPGHVGGWYSVRQIGTAIQFFGGTNETGLIILRAQTNVLSR